MCTYIQLHTYAYKYIFICMHLIFGIFIIRTKARTLLSSQNKHRLTGICKHYFGAVQRNGLLSVDGYVCFVFVSFLFFIQSHNTLLYITAYRKLISSVVSNVTNHTNELVLHSLRSQPDFSLNYFLPGLVC